MPEATKPVSGGVRDEPFAPLKSQGERQIQNRGGDRLSYQHSWELWNPGVIWQGEGFPIRPTDVRLPVLSVRETQRERHRERHRGEGVGSRPQNPFLLPAPLVSNLSCLCFRSGPASTLFWWCPGFETHPFFPTHLLSICWLRGTLAPHLLPFSSFSIEKSFPLSNFNPLGYVLQ